MDAEVNLQGEDTEGSWTLLSWLASCLMVFGGALPYVPQYQEIQNSNNSEGFSTRVCLVLLIANILRIFFWIGKQFELTLLIQSVVMIITMFAMLHLCCTVQSANRVSTKQHRLSDLNIDYFWKWSAFEDYLLFCFGFTVLCAVVTLLLLDSAVYVETLGSLALMFEAMLGLPQLFKNFHSHSTKGMRKVKIQAQMSAVLLRSKGNSVIPSLTLREVIDGWRVRGQRRRMSQEEQRRGGGG
uniref:solute carrier family 66 member 2 isoform X2 n=1 Tax=Scatophagus argus TaxID=75038 RepID=UPI001ED7FBFD|nr:solute carrier family 66 member 2 isoform X2 [Scatophagus argus]